VHLLRRHERLQLEHAGGGHPGPPPGPDPLRGMDHVLHDGDGYNIFRARQPIMAD